MSLLIPAALLGLGIVIGYITYRADVEFRGAAFAAASFSVMLLAPIACTAYGAWMWLRTGTWGAIAVEDVLLLLNKMGIDASFLMEPISWRGIQMMNEWYLGSNIGWTVFGVSLALLWWWLSASERASRSTKRK